MDILELLNGSLFDNKALKQLGKDNDASSTQVESLLTSSLPILLQGLAQNSSTKKGAESLSKALEQHSDDNTGSTVADYLKNVDLSDGKKILTKILGDDKTSIVKGLAGQTKLKTSQVTNLLATVAPLLLNLLFNKKESTGTSTSALSSMISLLLGGSDNDTSGISLASIATTLLGGSTSSSTSSSSSKKDDSDGTIDALASIASLLLGSK